MRRTAHQRSAKPREEPLAGQRTVTAPVLTARPDPPSVLALQRAAGNRATAALFEPRASDRQLIQRWNPFKALMGPAAPAVPNIGTVPTAVVDADFNALRDLGNQRGASPTQRALVAEIIATRGHITNFLNAGGGAHADRIYAGGAPAGYDLTYHADRATPKWDRLANLGHEMTHVAVNEAYDADFIMYKAPGAAAPPAPVFDVAGTRMTNEGARQQARRNAGAETIVVDNVLELRTQVDTAGLKKERKTAVQDKLAYAINSSPGAASLEYDTVINQVYLWLLLWGASRKTAFFRLLEQAVGDALANRDLGRAGHAGPILPRALPGTPGYAAAA